MADVLAAHRRFMAAAVEEAGRGGAEGNVAVGSVVVEDGRIVGWGRNLAASTIDPTAHAEVVALRDAARRLQRTRFEGCTLYTTWEPCPMCCGAIMTSGIETLVMGVRHDPETSRWGPYRVEDLVHLTRWGDRLRVVTGVLVDDCRAVRLEWEARNTRGPLRGERGEL